MCGDFNGITYHREKLGDRRKDQCKIDGFNNFLSNLQLEDLGTRGRVTHGLIIETGWI